MTKPLYGLIVFTAFSFISANSFSEVYRWVDENGQVHFGDKAHPHKRSDNITQDVQLKNLGYSASQTQQSLQQLESRQQAKSVENQQKQSHTNHSQEKRKSICNKARQQLSVLKGRVVFIDKNGKEVNVSETERQQRADTLQQEISRYCQ